MYLYYTVLRTSLAGVQFCHLRLSHIIIGLICVSVILLSNSNFQNVTSGMFSGACSAVLVVPADRIKCLLQVKH